MELRIEDYIIRADSECCWIEKEYVSEKTGKTNTKRVTGYFRDFEYLLADFARTKIRTSEAKSVKEVLEVIAESERDTIKMVKALSEHLKKCQKLTDESKTSK